MITKDYVSRETYKLLKEKGYDGEFKTCYDTEGYTYPAIHLYDAMKWLREAHKIDIDIISRLSLNADDDHCYSYILKHQYDKYHYKTYIDGEYLKFEEACKAAIKYCLENLI